MLIRHRLYLVAIHFLTVLMMAGCGSGSDSSAAITAPPDNAPPPAAVVISGVAAVGAPLANATVDIQDRTGKSVGSGQAAA